MSTDSTTPAPIIRAIHDNYAARAANHRMARRKAWERLRALLVAGEAAHAGEAVELIDALDIEPGALRGILAAVEKGRQLGETIQAGDDARTAYETAKSGRDAFQRITDQAIYDLQDEGRELTNKLGSGTIDATEYEARRATLRDQKTSILGQRETKDRELSGVRRGLAAVHQAEADYRTLTKENPWLRPDGPYPTWL